jgi:hypothetical protein
MYTLKNIFYFFNIVVGVILISTACTKPIAFNLPADENRLVVEGYLTPGKPMSIALQTSTGITSTLPLQLVGKALVIIRYGNISDTLRNIPLIDSANGRAYNYSSTKLMTEDYLNAYTLFVYDSTTRTSYTATTQLLRPVPIDSVNHTVNIDKEVSIGIKFTDPGSITNYYRRFAFTKELKPEGRANFRFSDRKAI